MDEKVDIKKGNSQEDANSYVERRFNRDARMRRLDKFERKFAIYVFALAGDGCQVVDIPCGSGRFLKIFSRAKRLTMVDLSPAMLQVAKETAEATESFQQIQFIQADITSIPLPDESADVCFSMRLFHHLPDDETRLSVLRELARVSKKYIALSFYNKDCIRYYMRKLFRKKIRGKYISFSQLVALAENAGLKLIERQPARNFIEQQCLVIFEKVTA